MIHRSEVSKCFGTPPVREANHVADSATCRRPRTPHRQAADQVVEASVITQIDNSLSPGVADHEHSGLIVALAAIALRL